MAEARRRINENSVITIVGKDGANPKREGSEARKRFDFYVNGMTVKEAKEAGVLAVDITYDFDHGFITLVEPEGSDEAEVTETAPKKKSRKAAAETTAADEAA